MLRMLRTLVIGPLLPRHMFKMTTQVVTRHTSSCWSCGRRLSETEAKSFFCSCKRLLPVNRNNNYFSLFGMKPDFKLETRELTNRFRQLMRALHPDLYAQKSQIEQELSADQSSLVNKAYRILSSPIQRACYLLELNGIDYETAAAESVEANPSQDVELLMHVLELNERLDEIERPEQVEELETKLGEIMAPFEENLDQVISKGNYRAAVHVISKMKYYQNVDERLQELKLKFNLLA